MNRGNNAELRKVRFGKKEQKKRYRTRFDAPPVELAPKPPPGTYARKERDNVRGV